MISSIRPPPPEIVYLQHEEPERLGFFGAVGVLVAAVIVFAAFGIVSSCYAQKGTRDYYGWGDYGSNRNYQPPQVYVVPVPVQPRYPDPPGVRYYCSMNNGREVCGIVNGPVTRDCVYVNGNPNCRVGGDKQNWDSYDPNAGITYSEGR